MLKKKNKIFLLLFFLATLNGYIFSSLINKSIEKKEKQKVEAFISFNNLFPNDNQFIGVLEIPKIKLKRGFYNISSKKNTVNKNIEMIETSLMPDKKNSNLILASHSGNSKISYFKKLYEVEIGDLAFIYYDKKKYTYKLLYKYDEKKDGILSIRRPFHQTNLTLITCDKKDNALQNVYIFKLMVE